MPACFHIFFNHMCAHLNFSQNVTEVNSCDVEDVLLVTQSNKIKSNQTEQIAVFMLRLLELVCCADRLPSRLQHKF